MKKLFSFLIIIFVVFFNISLTFAQDDLKEILTPDNLEDVVYFKDDITVRGEILELNTTRIVIKTRSDQTINRSFQEVSTILKEKVKTKPPFVYKTKPILPENSLKGYYVSGHIGLALANDVHDDGINIDFDTGMAFTLAVGNDFGKGRIEGEFAYQENNFNKISAWGESVGLTGDVTFFSFLINGYYNIINNKIFTPYVSAGFGVVRAKINDLNAFGSGLSDEKDKDTLFGYQIGAGIEYTLKKDVFIDVRYRYFITSDNFFNFTDSETDFDSHNLLLGLRVSF